MKSVRAVAEAEPLDLVPILLLVSHVMNDATPYC